MDEQRAADLFDLVADDYDNVGVDFFGPIASGLVEQLAPRPGEHVLDVGCGRGEVLLPMAAAVGASGRAVGIDVSAAMVEIARSEAERAGVSVELHAVDGMVTGLPPASFDVLASSLVLFFMPDPQGAVRAWRELLRPSGRLGISTFGPYTERWRDEVDAVLLRYAPPEVRDARTTGATGAFASDEAMEQLVRDAGFDHVRTVTTTVRPRFDDVAHWRRWSRSVGQRVLWDRIPADELPGVEAELAAAIDRFVAAEGHLGFDQQIRYTLAG